MLSITALYTGLIAILVVVLIFRVVAVRRDQRISLSDGGNEDLAIRIRQHANLIETAPLALFMLALLEINGYAPAIVLHAFGAGLVVARVLHALGMANVGPGFMFRSVGMASTILVLVAQALILIYGSLFVPI